MSGSVDEIQRRISERRARVYTASEFKAMVRDGRRPVLEDVDVVTCGTMGVMSGTMAVLSIPVADPGTFKRADSITINGVPGTVGPCPNESLGLVDCVVYGTARRDARYGGGHMFRDLVAGETVTNGSDDPFTTIFSGPRPMASGFLEASVSGCGEINPIQNDPGLDYLRAGASVLLNGAPGMVIGTGTRSTPGKPNLSVAADMKGMSSEYMGGFVTSEGPECITSVATAIPVTDGRALEGVSVLDEEVELPLADVRDRKPVHSDTYASVWGGTDLSVTADLSKCLNCTSCRADEFCPCDASPSGGIDPVRCMSCGLCVRTCVGNVFSCDTGSLDFGGRPIPIAVRQSSRFKAERLCSEVKALVESGDWFLRCFDGRI